MHPVQRPLPVGLPGYSSGIAINLGPMTPNKLPECFPLLPAHFHQLIFHLIPLDRSVCCRFQLLKPSFVSLTTYMTREFVISDNVIEKDYTF